MVLPYSPQPAAHGFPLMTQPIYLDYAATTPIDPRVAERMIECLLPSGPHGNPASGHSMGRAARALVEQARAQVATVIGAQPQSIVWTSGATESDNLALFGAARFNAERGRHIVSAKTEHKAVLDALKQLEREGFQVTLLKPDDRGIVLPEQVRDALRNDTILVSLMHVNNETGVIQDVSAVGQLCRERGVLLHVDAAQSIGKLPVDVEAMHIDLLSLTAHKCYGPKGIGALYVRRQPPVGLRPMLFGGGQEGGLRSGTLPTHQIVGMGAAFALAHAEQQADAARLAVLRDRLWQGIAIAWRCRNQWASHPVRREYSQCDIQRCRRREPAIRVSRDHLLSRCGMFVGFRSRFVCAACARAQRSTGQ